MRVVRIHGCLPTLVLLLALALVVGLALAAGTVFLAVAAALALAVALLRWLLRLGRPAPAARRPGPPGAARDQVIDVRVDARRVDPPRLPPPDPGGG